MQDNVAKFFPPNAEGDKIVRAMDLAGKAHKGQTRKYGGKPYIVHPAAVYSNVSGWSAGRVTEQQWLTMACAAWLHDVLEDGPQMTKEEIIEATDEATYNLVLELTNPSKSSKAPRAVRKQMDRDHLSHVSWEAKIIKMFDRIVANMARELAITRSERFVDAVEVPQWL